MPFTDQELSAFLSETSDLVIAYGLDLLGAILILLVGWLVASWAKRAARRALDRTGKVDETLKPFIANVVRYFILVLVLIAVLAQFGIQTASIIAVLGAAGLAIGLALQGTLQNIAAGMMLLFLRPFRTGEYIDADGIAGTVDEIGLFTSHMRTADGVYTEVPNSMLWNRPITNYSRMATRRLDLDVGIGYGDDIDKAQAALMDLLTADSRVRTDPAEPQVLVSELGDSAVVLRLRCWTATADYWPLRFDLTKAAKQRLDREGISIPFPQRDVHLFTEEGDDGGAAAPQAKSAAKKPARKKTG